MSASRSAPRAPPPTQNPATSGVQIIPERNSKKETKRVADSSEPPVPTLPANNVLAHEVVTPTNIDVLFGRDKVCFNHPGNICFRTVINAHAEDYESAPSRRDKSCIVYTVFDTVRGYGGRFLKRAGPLKEWVVVTDVEATQKVGHALRDKKQHTQEPTPAKVIKMKEELNSQFNQFRIKSNLLSKKKKCAKLNSKSGQGAASAALLQLGEICSQEIEAIKDKGDSERSDDASTETETSGGNSTARGDRTTKGSASLRRNKRPSVVIKPAKARQPILPTRGTGPPRRVSTGVPAPLKKKAKVKGAAAVTAPVASPPAVPIVVPPAVSHPAASINHTTAPVQSSASLFNGVSSGAAKQALLGALAGPSTPAAGVAAAPPSYATEIALLAQQQKQQDDASTAIHHVLNRFSQHQAAEAVFRREEEEAAKRLLVRQAMVAMAARQQREEELASEFLLEEMERRLAAQQQQRQQQAQQQESQVTALGARYNTAIALSVPACARPGNHPSQQTYTAVLEREDGRAVTPPPIADGTGAGCWLYFPQGVPTLSSNGWKVKLLPMNDHGREQAASLPGTSTVAAAPPLPPTTTSNPLELDTSRISLSTFLKDRMSKR